MEFERIKYHFSEEKKVITLVDDVAANNQLTVITKNNDSVYFETVTHVVLESYMESGESYYGDNTIHITLYDGSKKLAILNYENAKYIEIEKRNKPSILSDIDEFYLSSGYNAQSKVK